MGGHTMSNSNGIAFTSSALDSDATRHEESFDGVVRALLRGYRLRLALPAAQGRGVGEGTVMARCRPTTGAFTVLIGGEPVTRVTSMSIGNSTNCPTNVRLAPRQTKVLVSAG